jgi:hypothetical protein
MGCPLARGSLATRGQPTSFAIPSAGFRDRRFFAMISARLRSTPCAGIELPARIARPVVPLPAVRTFFAFLSHSVVIENNYPLISLLAVYTAPCRRPILELRRTQKMDRHETRETGRFVAKDAAGNDHEIVRTQDFVSYDFQGGTMQLAGRKHLKTAAGGSKVTRKGKGKYLIAGTIETPITTLDQIGR